MGRKLDKFSLLMWKNGVVLKRSPISTISMIIIPILLASILVIIRSLIDFDSQPPVNYPPVTVFPPDKEISLVHFEEILYSPSSNTEISSIINTLQKYLLVDTVIACENRHSLEQYYLNSLNLTNSTINTFGIQFDDKLGNQATLPKDIKVSIRFPSEKFGSKYLWWTDALFPAFKTPGPREGPDFDPPPGYIRTGFLTVQQALAYAIYEYNKINTATLPKINLERYPYPSYNNDLFNTAMENSIGILIILSFMWIFINTVRGITTEKERQLKESMKIMGLPGWLHWLAWYLRTFILLLIAIIGITIVLKINFKYAAVLPKSDGFLLFVFFLIYGCSIITFSFLCSVFFTKANTAAAFSAIIWFLSYLPYSIMVQQYDTLSLGQKLGASLLSNSGLCYAMLLYLRYESIEEGLQWSNVWKTVTPDDNLTFGAILLMIILDIFIYLLLALYIEAIFPGDYGVPQPWYFPFTRKYWTGTEKGTAVSDNSDEIIDVNLENFEKTPDLPAGIRIKNLSKRFGHFDAVKNLNLDLYEGQITVLLGHNGAGKTTTMSMLTGIFPPTSGTAIVNGHDIRTDIDGVRDDMGLCLQHNVLFDDLTVWEHLYFFGRLKGLKTNEIDDEIKNYIRLLELEDKTHAATKTLSGGMKRKVAIGVAMCGRSKVVMLDEPTAGMDPSARRAIWDLLQKQKHGRTILLTTHFMDEADLLGDRIAIMAAGQLQCCGSSFFLKKRYGAGYYLIIDKSENCVPDKITAVLRKHIRDIKIESNIGSELTYLLPDNQSSKFELMLRDLEGNSKNLGIRSYGVSLTTLEEVFMKVGADKDNKVSLKNLGRENQHNHNGNNENVMVLIDESFKPNSQLLTGFKLIKNQSLAMLMKKALSQLRSYLTLLLQILLPIFILILTVETSDDKGQDVNQQPLIFTLDHYYDPVTLISESDTDQYYKKYLEILKSKKYNYQTTDNITETILNDTEQIPATVKLSYIIGVTFATAITAWYNGAPYHSSPLTLAAVLNTLYKTKLNDSYNIEFINHPLPYSLTLQVNELSVNIIGYQLSIALGYGMAFVASFFILFSIRERACKAKHLQMVSGVNPFIFWFIAYLWDFLCYCVTMTCVIITLAALQANQFSSPGELGRLTVVLIYFGCFVIPFMYVGSLFFTTPSVGYSRMMLLGAITGIIGLIVVAILEIEPLDLMYVAVPLHWVLLFIPFYSLSKGIYDLSTITNTIQTCDYLEEQYPGQGCQIKKECCSIPGYYNMNSPGIGRNVMLAFILTIVLCILLLLNEYGVFSAIKSKIFDKHDPPIANQSEDNDVTEERNRIKSLSPADVRSQYILVLKDVTKYYKKFLAVNGLSLGIKPYECFGLLGVNGAGKTTTFKMMTGDERISYGDAWIKGLSVSSQQKQVQKFIGYCPQFDALLDDLTARETLKMFGLIRGVPLEDCNTVGEQLAHDFDFYKHLDKKVRELSGGNKRKLSTAIALIGDPPVIFLDEPTTGMDPATKRYLWNCLSRLRDNGKCIILTSHSMEECEALCTRLVIMVNGQFQCLGSTQHLKNKFAQGFSLIIKLKKSEDYRHLEQESTDVDNFIKQQFPGAILKEKHRELLTYQLTSTGMPWSKMFGILERSKRELNIEDYSLGQCSLEQVFLSFTKYQR